MLPLDLHELVGSADAIGQLANRAGFVFSRLADERAGPAADTSDQAASATAASRFAHAAGFLVATPQGRISRYFLGVRHDPQALRSALDAAAGDSIGSLVDRLVLLCAHFDPSLGRFSQPVLTALAPPRHRTGAGPGRLDLATQAPGRPRRRDMNGSTDSALAPSFRLIEQSASTIAERTDLLFLSMLVVCGVMALVLAGLVVYFSIRYRRGSNVDPQRAAERRARPRGWRGRRSRCCSS